MLKQQLIMFLAVEPLWESQMSTQITALLDLGDALMIRGFEAKVASLNRVRSNCSQLRVVRKSDNFHIRLGLWKARSLN